MLGAPILAHNPRRRIPKSAVLQQQRIIQLRYYLRYDMLRKRRPRPRKQTRPQSAHIARPIAQPQQWRKRLRYQRPLFRYPQIIVQIDKPPPLMFHQPRLQKPNFRMRRNRALRQIDRLSF